MKTVDQDTGHSFWLDMTDEYLEELSLCEQPKCNHDNQVLTESFNSIGARQLRKQCLKCGMFTSQNISAKKIGDKVAVPWRSEIAEEFTKANDSARTELTQKYIRKQKANKGSRAFVYEEYLKTPAWKSLRVKVFKRSIGNCEGCADNRATEVHHLTYDRLGYEMLFDLVAVCRPCHEIIHLEKTDSPDAVDLRVSTSIISKQFAESIGEGTEQFEDVHNCQCRYYSDGESEAECLKFEMCVSAAIATDGPCGPHRHEHEALGNPPKNEGTLA
jgi:hypothetical protein